MAKDERLWMRFPIDMHRHPIFARLNADVRWTFVEMNGEARIAKNDGVFNEADAEFMWPVEHLTALVNSHPVRAVVLHEGGKYIIREYGQHQFPEADREALALKRSESGKAGAAKRWGSKPMASDSNGMASAKQTVANTWQPIAESESESELETERLITTGSQSGLSPVTRENADGDMTDYYEPVKQVLMHEAAIPNPTPGEIHAWVTFLASKARTAVKDERAYAISAAERFPDEVDRWFVKHRRNQMRAVNQ